MFTSAPSEAPREALHGGADTLADTIRTAFAAVLQHDGLGDDDDFFDLGGDSILAVELFLHLQRDTGREFPVTSIYDAPTVRALARLLGGAPARPAPRDSCIVMLRAPRPGASVPPLFIVHGIDGLILTFNALASGINDGRAIYGIEAPGIDGATKPLDRVEDMAARYVAAVREIQPQGPYVMAGYSFGGLVAFEMACRLRAESAEVARLILLDTLPHPDNWPLDARLVTLARLLPAYLSLRVLRRVTEYSLRRLKHAAASPRGFKLGRTFRWALAAPFDVSRAGFVTRMAAAAQRYDVPGTLANLSCLARVNQAGVIAYRAYRPSRFPGTIDFVKATAEDFLPYAPHRVWRGLAHALRVRRITSSHIGLVRENAASAALALSDCLRTVPDDT